MIDMPGLLGRLVHILRIVNYGPKLADLIAHNIVPQAPITSDILTFFSSVMGISDWDHFASLEQLVEEGRGDESHTGAGLGQRSPNSPRSKFALKTCHSW